MKTPAQCTIRPARNEEAEALNQLTRRSTMHWGYEPAFLDFEPEALRVDAAFMERARVFLLEDSEALIGYYAFVEHDGLLSFDKLFVEPRFIGTGCGRLLWEHAVEQARRWGAKTFSFVADPNAAPFYSAMGATFIREIETGWPGWNLHEFRFDIEND